MIISTNSCFLEEDYQMDNKPTYEIVLDEFIAKGVVISVLEIQVQPLRVASAQERGEPYSSGRVVRQPSHFIGLGQVPEEPEMDP